MRRELDIHRLRSQVRTADRLQELRRQAGSPTDAFSGARGTWPRVGRIIHSRAK